MNGMKVNNCLPLLKVGSGALLFGPQLINTSNFWQPAGLFSQTNMWCTEEQFNYDMALDSNYQSSTEAYSSEMSCFEDEKTFRQMSFKQYLQCFKTFFLRPSLSGENNLRNHFWLLESGFLTLLRDFSQNYLSPRYRKFWCWEYFLTY